MKMPKYIAKHGQNLLGQTFQHLSLWNRATSIESLHHFRLPFSLPFPIPITISWVLEESIRRKRRGETQNFLWTSARTRKLSIAIARHFLRMNTTVKGYLLFLHASAWAWRKVTIGKMDKNWAQTSCCIHRSDTDSWPQKKRRSDVKYCRKST